MSKIRPILGLLAGIIILLFVLWGGTELIALIFDVEDEGNKRLIRWGLLAVFLALGSVLRKKFPSLR